MLTHKSAGTRANALEGISIVVLVGLFLSACFAGDPGKKAPPSVGEPVPVTVSEDGNYVGIPIWSPDSSRIAIYYVDEPCFEIFCGEPHKLDIKKADGSAWVRISSPAGPDMPEWSPDGRRLAFEAHAFGDPPAIYTTDANGGNGRFVVNGEKPLWSPDGSRIAYFGDSDTCNGVCVVAADGTGQRQLTTTRAIASDAGPYEDFRRQACWLNSGQLVFFDASWSLQVIGMEQPGEMKQIFASNVPAEYLNLVDYYWVSCSSDGKRVASQRGAATSTSSTRMVPT